MAVTAALFSSQQLHVTVLQQAVSLQEYKMTTVIR